MDSDRYIEMSAIIRELRNIRMLMAADLRLRVADSHNPPSNLPPGAPKEIRKSVLELAEELRD